MNHSRGASTAPIVRKRKERDDLFIHPNGSGKSRVTKTSPPLPSPSPSHTNTTSLKKKPSELSWSNRLVAGFMAHEFLTEGTLLDQKLADPVEVEKKPGESSAAPEKGYAEVAHILKEEGAHIQGIVNPTQLARWIEM